MLGLQGGKFGRYTLCGAIYTCFQTFFRENCFENVVSEIHKNDLFCPYNPPKIRNDFMFAIFFYIYIFFFLVFAIFSKSNFLDRLDFFLTNLTPHFQNSFPHRFFWFCNLHSKMSKNMCKWSHKVCNGLILPP